MVQPSKTELRRNRNEKTITIAETETVIKNLSTTKSSEPDGFTGKLYQILRGQLTHILPQNYKERNASKLIQWGHDHPDTKT